MNKELQKAYEDYIDLLVAELNDVVPLAFVHGWKSSRGDAGEAARQRIEKLLNPEAVVATD